MIDPDTPLDKRSTTSSKGVKMSLVFSDEFEQEGRTFFKDDDPFFEAMDLYYWQTGDYEIYKPEMVNTSNGRLMLHMERYVNSTGAPLKSGMIQSWNKFCFQGGKIEIKAALPGFGMPRDQLSQGYWPGLWMMGNLGRAGFGASTDGIWPYTYDSCDSGVNQTQVSALPGQRINKCMANPGVGLHPHQGRGSPEIDLLEGMVSYYTAFASQSYQIAPFSVGQGIIESEATIHPGTQRNAWPGSPYQESISANALLNPTAYAGNNGSAIFAVEYVPSAPSTGELGYISWSIDGSETWRLEGAALAADDIASQRLIPTEPLYLILNLASGPSWGAPNLATMQLPNALEVEYVRVFQPTGSNRTSCDPPDHPTKKYIEAHIDMYNDSSVHRWNRTKYPIPHYELPTATHCPDNCNAPNGRCSLLTQNCSCNIGFNGTTCADRTVNGVCAELLLEYDLSCAPSPTADRRILEGIFEWTCGPEYNARNVSKCAIIDSPRYSNCSSLEKAVWVMSNYFNHYKPTQGDGACWFGGVARIIKR